MFIDKINKTKTLKRRQLEAKIRIVFFLIHQIKILSSKNYNQQMSQQNPRENFRHQTILEN
jgi:hypothetical protein